MQRLLDQIGRTPRLTVINLLKRSQGLTVRELAAKLDMSYMGVKQICLDLEKDGFLDTFRRHRGIGRPELLYRLTDKANALFPQADNSMALSMLDQARKLYGSGAAEKMLFLHFQEKTEEYAANAKGETLESRVRSLAKLRDREGYTADLVEENPPLQVIERHHPMQPLLEAYPNAVNLERDMIQKVLGAPVRFEQAGTGAAWERRIIVG